MLILRISVRSLCNGSHDNNIYCQISVPGRLRSLIEHYRLASSAMPREGVFLLFEASRAFNQLDMFTYTKPQVRLLVQRPSQTQYPVCSKQPKVGLHTLDPKVGIIHTLGAAGYEFHVRSRRVQTRLQGLTF